MPDRGAFVKELLVVGNKQYREVYFKPYRIIYRSNKKTVFIVLVADGRRDLKSLLGKRLNT
jgi:toxin ParE1/3/4